LAEPAETPSLLATVRAFGVMLGGPLVLLLGAVWSTATVTAALAAGKRPSRSAQVGLPWAVLHFAVMRPWLRNWGTTPEERSKPLPGDELVPAAASQQTRAVTINAPVEEVWPWLAQIGQDRGGFYSYEWLENLAGCQMRNADRVHPEWQERELGEKVMFHPALGVPLGRFDPGRALGFEGGWYFALEAVGGDRTRLFARTRAASRGALAYAVLLEIPHFVMERRMLLGIKERAERNQIAEAGSQRLCPP
jgi:hypothetical protein